MKISTYKYIYICICINDQSLMRYGRYDSFQILKMGGHTYFGL